MDRASHDPYAMYRECSEQLLAVAFEVGMARAYLALRDEQGRGEAATVADLAGCVDRIAQAVNLH